MHTFFLSILLSTFSFLFRCWTTNVIPLLCVPLLVALSCFYDLSIIQEILIFFWDWVKERTNRGEGKQAVGGGGLFELGVYMSKRQLKCIHEIMCALNKGHRLRIYKVEKTRFWTSKYRDKRKRREKIDLNQHIFFLAETQMLFAVRVGVSKKKK